MTSINGLLETRRTTQALTGTDRRRPAKSRRIVAEFVSVPSLLTAQEVAKILRTTRKAVYKMAERGLLPGVIRIGRRLLVRSDLLLDWLDKSRAPSPEE
jgi:excisionase family DNA binding protein